MGIPEVIAITAVLATIGGTAASIAAQPEPPKLADDIFAPKQEDVGEARRQQKLRASARLGSQKTILAGANAPEKSTVGTPTLLGG